MADLELPARQGFAPDASPQMGLPDEIPITLTINGERRALHVRPWTTLLDLLREDLSLYGTKKGCDHGQCGACTVLLDGERINSCLALAVTKDGSELTTVEGLAGKDGALHPMQEAFIEHDAFQCGYCTPGQICSAKAMLAEAEAGWPSLVSETLVSEDPASPGGPVRLTREEIAERMSGNLCRCGAYSNIVDAITEVMEAGQ
jgi:xanthine dehydrogenase YagT iron-sulfur-binding subunit